jgi:uncharacterized protein YjhX (UPF0386 family)
MVISSVETAVLHALVNAECDRGSHVSLNRLCAQVSTARDARSPSNVLRTLRELRRKRFVVFADGDAVRITDTGLAALKAM